jgi:hypothetical protein
MIFEDAYRNIFAAIKHLVKDVEDIDVPAAINAGALVTLTGRIHAFKSVPRS